VAVNGSEGLGRRELWLCAADGVRDLVAGVAGPCEVADRPVAGSIVLPVEGGVGELVEPVWAAEDVDGVEPLVGGEAPVALGDDGESAEDSDVLFPDRPCVAGNVHVGQPPSGLVCGPHSGVIFGECPQCGGRPLSLQ